MEKKIILVTAVFGKSTEELRIKLALRTVGEALQHNYEIVVVDGSPVESGIGCALKEVGKDLIHYEREVEGGMGASRRQAVRKALDLGADIVVWLEPEKHTIVRHLSECVETMLENDYDIVVPFRETLDSYPEYQQYSELRAHREIGHIIGRQDLDLMIGPRIMNQEAAELFLSYVGAPGHDNWESIFISVLWAIRDGMNIGSCTIPYLHPPEQTADEQGDVWDKKRDTQRINIVKTMKEEADKCGALV
jgi:hypothetical protein